MNNLNDIFFAPSANQELTYEQILEDVQRYFAENHAATIAEAGDGNTDRASSLLKELMVQYIVKRKYAIEGLTTEELCEKLYEDMAGYSFLKKWIYKPGIEEVNINAYNDIEVIEAGGRSVKIPDKFSSPQHAIDVVRRMAETIPAPHSIQIWFHWMESPLTKGVKISLKTITVTQNGRSISYSIILYPCRSSANG